MMPKHRLKNHLRANSLMKSIKNSRRKSGKAEKNVKDSEVKIASMEKRIAELDELLSKPENAADMTLVTEYTSTKQALDEENERWMQMSEELETLQNS